LDGVVVENIDKLGKFLDGDHLGDGDAFYFLWLFIEHIVTCLVHLDVRDQFLVNFLSMALAFEVCCEHCAELRERNKTPFILNHLIELLLQVIENTIVNVQQVDLPNDLGCKATLSTLSRHNSVNVPIHDLRPHWLRSLNLVLVFHTILASRSLRRRYLCTANLLLDHVLGRDAVICNRLLHLLVGQV
jgi:hypothetical protein